MSHGLKDTGKRMSFASGMVREPDAGNGRYDLITPIGLLNTMLGMRDITNLSASVLERLAVHYERGAMKYSDRNWEKGGSLSRHLNSALRHLRKRLAKMTDEDHLAAFVWNVWCIMHHVTIDRPDLYDMVHYLSDDHKAANVQAVFDGISEDYQPLAHMQLFMIDGDIDHLSDAIEAACVLMNQEETC